MSNALEKNQIQNNYSKIIKKYIKKVFMLKFLHIAQMFNFCIFLAYLSLDFKHVVLSRLDKILGLRYMVGRL
jgi:hypothetical protein